MHRAKGAGSECVRDCPFPRDHCLDCPVLRPIPHGNMCRTTAVKLRAFFPVAVIALTVGCGGDKWLADRPHPVPVTGTVFHNDQPVEGASVVFVPSGHTYAAAGKTDAEGRFRLQTFGPDDGAVPGTYRVTVRKVELPDQGGSGVSDDAERPEGAEMWLLPGKYSDAGSSGLTATVDEGGENDIPLQLVGPAGPPPRHSPSRPVNTGE